MKVQNKLRRSAIAAGFSLIEVTISVAITAVALVSLMGMLPKGMQTMSAATDRAIEARIHQQIVGELMLTEWEKRAVYDNELRGYDDQGVHIMTGSTVFAGGRAIEDVIYRARITLPSRPVTMPGGEIDPNLQLVLIEVTGLAQPNFDFDKVENQRHVHTYQSMLVKMGQNFGN